MKRTFNKAITMANVVGPALRRFRNERGLTQEQLAAQCQVRGINLTRGTLAKIEAQVRFVKACELFVIGKILKVPLEHFFTPEFARSVGSNAEVDGRVPFVPGVTPS